MSTHLHQRGLPRPHLECTQASASRWLGGSRERARFLLCFRVLKIFHNKDDLLWYFEKQYVIYLKCILIGTINSDHLAYFYLVFKMCWPGTRHWRGREIQRERCDCFIEGLLFTRCIFDVHSFHPLTTPGGRFPRVPVIQLTLRLLKTHVSCMAKTTQ